MRRPRDSREPRGRDEEPETPCRRLLLLGDLSELVGVTARSPVSRPPDQLGASLEMAAVVDVLEVTCAHQHAHGVAARVVAQREDGVDPHACARAGNPYTLAHRLVEPGHPDAAPRGPVMPAVAGRSEAVDGTRG